MASKDELIEKKSITAKEIINMYGKDSKGNPKHITSIKEIKAFLDGFIDDETLTIEQECYILYQIHSYNKDIIKAQKRRKAAESISIPTKSVEAIDERKSNIYDVTSLFNSMDGLDNLELMNELLPSYYDKDFDKIMSALRLLILKKKKEDKILGLEDPSFKEVVKETIEKYDQMLRIIDEHIEEEKEAEESEKVSTDDNLSIKRNVVFLRKPDGSYYTDDDIDGIYDKKSYAEVLRRIATDTITKKKRFHEDPGLQGVIVIRLKKIRVAYMEAENNTAVIIAAIAKNFQAFKTYYDYIKSRKKRFESIKDIVDKCITNQEYLESERQILTNIVRSHLKKDKSQPCKGGVSNE